MLRAASIQDLELVVAEKAIRRVLGHCLYERIAGGLGYFRHDQVRRGEGCLHLSNDHFLYRWGFKRHVAGQRMIQGCSETGDIVRQETFRFAFDLLRGDEIRRAPGHVLHLAFHVGFAGETEINQFRLYDRRWESKSVEQQQAEMAGRRKSPPPPTSPDKQKQDRQREGLLLSRTHLLRQIEASPHPGRRQILEQALAEIDCQLASFE